MMDFFYEIIKTPKLDGVQVHHQQQQATVDCTLCITGHHLLLSARQDNNQELWLLHKNIDSIEKKPFMLQNAVIGGMITLKCKDLRIISIEINFTKDYYNVVSSLEAINALQNVELLYPFFYRPMYSIFEDGYTMYRPEQEFAKLISSANYIASGNGSNHLNAANTNSTNANANAHTNTNTNANASRNDKSNGSMILSLNVNLDNCGSNGAANLNAESSTNATSNGVGCTFDGNIAYCEWRISTVNKDFSVCPTYGATLIVPKTITDEQIIQSAAFRDGGRFPVLSYKHDNGASLLRSSQPISIQGIKRCRADEAILNVVLGRSKKGFIVDTWGKGKSNTETDQHYSQWKKVNRAIGNVSTPSSILDSFAKLMDACNDIHCNADKWLSRLESSNWLSMVLNSLNAACIVAQCLDQEGSPVLVHGASGLDSTLIVTSLVQIILNPDCRTVKGLQALIEREWIQAGHPFSTRHRYSCYTASQIRPKNAGATFVLFLDCVFQLYQQFPCSFEFNTQMLILLFEHSYFSQYGTFLCDSERERYEFRVHKRTTSLWSHLNRPEVLKSLLNPLYEPNLNVIWPSVAPISLELWNELYLRWTVDQKHIANKMTQIQELITLEKELRTKALKLRKQATDLNQELQELLSTPITQ